MGYVSQYVRKHRRVSEEALPPWDLSTIFKSPVYLGALHRDLSTHLQRASAADQFFQEHEPAFYALDHGFYGFAYTLWVDVLRSIRLLAPAIFRQIHKGTPYYAMARALFFVNDFDRAEHYLVAALTEDEANHGRRIAHQSQAAAFLTCADDQFLGGFSSSEIPLIQRARAGVAAALNRFLVETEREFPLSLLRATFLGPAVFGRGSPFAVTPAWRTVAAGFLCYILEFEVCEQDLALGSPHGGSLQLPFSHLFRGCHLLEMLMRIAADKSESTEREVTLHWLIKYHQERSGLGLRVFQTSPPEVKESSVGTILGLVVRWESMGIPIQDRAFWLTYGLRNALGHSHLWPVSLDAQSYARLAMTVQTALLWTLFALFQPQNE